MKRLFASAIIAYLGYRFWKEFEQNQTRNGKLTQAIPGLQSDDVNGLVWKPDGPQYAGVTEFD